MMQPARAAHGAFLARPSWGPRKAGRLCGERRSSVVIELSCLHGSERYAACFDEVVARAVRVSQPAVLSALLVIQLFGIVIPPPNFPKEHQKERCGHYSVAALLHYVLWCASEYFVVGRISCHVPYDNIETNVCQWLFSEIFFLLLPILNRIDSIRNLYIFFALNFSTLEKRASVFSHLPIHPTPRPHLQTSPDCPHRDPQDCHNLPGRCRNCRSGTLWGYLALRPAQAA